MNGEYIAAFPAYGYQKDPEDRHRLIHDEHAPVVQRMFRMVLEGATCFYIARTLKKEQVLTPRACLMGKYVTFQTAERVRHPYRWAKTSVYSILSNPVYLGKLVSQRHKKQSFKDKRFVSRPEEEWVIVESTHEALVDQETFDLVQRRIEIKQPATWANTINIYRGLLVCNECKTRMVYSSRTDRKSAGHFACSKYRRYGGGECSGHYITVEQVRELLLCDIGRHAMFT